MTALDEIRLLARDLQACELEVAKARARLNTAVIRATDRPTEIAKAAGFSRQYVSKLKEGHGK
jgi:hypothetical protein